MSATFDDYVRELKENNGNDVWVKKSATPANDIYWKLIQSGSAKKRKMANYPDNETIKTNLKRLAKIVSALSISSGFNLYVNSGYRNTAVNEAVGGVENSQHLKGQATDLDVESETTPLSVKNNEVQNAKLFLFILNNEQWKNKFDQIIWEESGSSNWVHCSFVCKSDDIGNDSSYSPRAYSSGRKVMWFTGGKYVNLWSSTYKRESSDGYVYFEKVPSLRGIKYDGRGFSVDYSTLGNVEGSVLSDNSYSNSGAIIGGAGGASGAGGSSNGRMNDPHLSASVKKEPSKGLLLGSEFKIK